MKHSEILKTVEQRAELTSRDAAASATAAVLDTLGERLSGNEPRNLADQLPQELGQLLTRHTGAPEKYNLDEFLRRVADRHGHDWTREDADSGSRAVLSTIGEFVSEGEMSDLRSQLPPDFSILFT